MFSSAATSLFCVSKCASFQCGTTQATATGGAGSVAGADAKEGRATGVTGLTAGAAGTIGTGSTFGAGSALIHTTVTIVVTPVTDLAFGASGRDVAGQTATIGETDVLSSFETITTSNRTGFVFVAEVFVDRTVTVVVSAVTGFSLGLTGLDIAFNAEFVAFADEFTGLFALSFADGADFALGGKAFVDRAITVVVFAVTDFGAFGTGRDTAGCATVVFFADGVSGAFADTKTDATAFSEIGVILVDLTVTIVVLAVALFQLWLTRCCVAGGAFSVTATSVLAFATADPFAAEAFFAKVVEVFVYFAVAIVVFAVTRIAFGWSDTRSIAGDAEFVIATDVLSGAFAFAEAESAGFVEIFEVFVDGAVTIVVFAITDFGEGLCLIFAGTPEPSDALLNAIFAGSDATGVFGTIVAGASHGSRVAFFVVHDTITIVILVVAEFGDRLVGLLALFRAFVAGINAFGTLAFEVFDDAVFAHIGEALVGLPVAVVVFAVAGFFAGENFFFALAPLTEAAETQAFATGSYISCRRSAGVAGLLQGSFETGEVVYNAVTVVVFVVADFLIRTLVSLTGQPLSCVTTLPAAFALTDIGTTAALVAGTAAIREFFVHRAVAIVVFAITDLGDGFDRAFAIAPFGVGTGLLALTTLSDFQTTGTNIAIFAKAGVFVHLTVAVVVDLVFAAFGSTRIDKAVVVIAVLVSCKAVLVVVSGNTLSSLADL